MSTTLAHPARDRNSHNPGASAGYASASRVPAKRAGFRPDIEGLRAIAVLLVVAYHVRMPGVTGGFIGVDVFFVLSGYLITMLLVREIEREGSLDLVQFYARRARRLLPAAALVVVATLVAAAFILSPLELQHVSRTAVATSMYLSNFWFLRESADYFSPTAETNPLLHTWSLAVEEQFYLTWPLLVLLGMRVGRGRGGLMVVLGAATLVSWLACIWLTHIQQPWAFYATPARGWQFALGGLASFIPGSWLRARARWSAVVGWIGLAIILMAAVRFSDETLFPGTAALLPVLGTVAVLAAGVMAPGAGVGHLLNRAPLQRLGQLSYSWYLWHWPALIFAAALIPSITGVQRIAVAAASLGLAALSYSLVENPIRFHGSLVRRSALSLGLAAALTLTGVGLSVKAHSVSARAIGTPEQNAFAAAAADGFDGGDGMECFSATTRSEVEECILGDSSSAVDIVLFGDSHAYHWLPVLDDLANEHGWRLVAMTKGQCPTARLPVYHPRLKREFHECIDFREAAFRRIAELRPAAVVLVNSAIYVEGYDRRGPVSQFTAATWGEGIRTTLLTLDSLRVPTILLHDSPRMPEDIPNCLSRAAFHSRDLAESCGLEKELALDADVIAAEREAARGLPHVSVLDLSDHFCDRDHCGPMRDGVVIYRDGDHLTGTFVRSLAPVLQRNILPRLAAGGDRSD